VGTYFDVFDSNGCMISLLAVDEEMKACLGKASGYDFTV
jgi:dihydroxyacetone kinase